MRLKSLLLLPLLGALTACTMNDLFEPEPTTRTIETTTTTTEFTEDGPVTTTSTSVREEDILRVPEQDISGYWTMRVAANNKECAMDLAITAATGAETTDRRVSITPGCDAGLNNVVRWRLLEDGDIEFRNGADRLLGRFDKPSSGNIYSGYIELDSGGRSSATIYKFA